MEDICKKFPKICNCPYKEDIDNDLKKGKTPYYIRKWLKETECPISEDTIRRYQKYLIEHGGITREQKQASPSHTEDTLLTKLEQKATEALDSLDLDNVSDNVKVQLILGVSKLIYGTKINANINTPQPTHKTDSTVLEELLNDIRERSD